LFPRTIQIKRKTPNGKKVNLAIKIKFGMKLLNGNKTIFNLINTLSFASQKPFFKEKLKKIKLNKHFKEHKHVNIGTSQIIT
jgi:hypothetical protein